NAETLSATFTAPTSAQTLIFKFTATDFRGASSSENITVSVIAPTSDNDTNTSSGGSSSWLILLLLLPLSIRKIYRVH
ncbi:MAG: GlyGly-CTERM sorting domain-containing protein, partial [Gammaproteobacteria bacterium]|nr:GlyGly-CTERM sorting domain-containing protein [Gammaproteobacteria bacterium]